MSAGPGRFAAGGDAPPALRDAIAKLEDEARVLDLGPAERERLWEAVGAEVRTLEDRHRAPAYTTDAGPSAEAFGVGEDPGDLAEALATLGAASRPGINQTSGGHLAYIPGGGLLPSGLGDLLADVANPYIGIQFGAPAAARMERSLVRWMADLVGYPATAGGDLTSGGSIATLQAVVTAREAHEIRSADVPRSVVYLTDHTHHAADKALRVAGLAECVVRRVALDDGLRMRPDALREAVVADRAAGLRPWLVVATAGSTDVGAVDPLAAIAVVAAECGLWLHVDAAYGGFFLLTAHGRRLLAGIERSDSVVMDPHKGLFVPFGSGALLVRDEHRLAKAHHYSAGYLGDAQAAAGSFSPADVSLELTRPFRAPRLWLPLKLFGIAPFRAALDEKLLLARHFAERIARVPGFTVVAPPDLSVVAFRYAAGGGPEDDEVNRRLAAAVSADGRAVISATTIGGRYTLRVAILHYRTHLEHVDALLDVLAREAPRP
ncbi:MAG: aminotransferase class V-fold PLP-dependent enzyme [Actinomycetota bacterium]|nr:aminotransferase class V-fold PLP-dependent enzyme [Actinomycetota bacterium]